MKIILKRKTILIVEDDEKIALALSVRLKAAGYEILVAKDGQKGLALARVNWPDLVLLDIGLPIMDIWMPLGVGYSVARRLKRMGNGCIPFIFITASREQGRKEAARQLGAAGCFEKPFDAEELLSTINRVLHPAAPAGESILDLSEFLLPPNPLRGLDASLLLPRGESERGAKESGT